MMEIELHKNMMNDVYVPYLECDARTQIFFGGSASGKSKFAVGQRVIYNLINGGRNYLICRQTKNSIRGSVATEVKKVISEWGLTALFDVNKTDGTVTCINGYQAHFAGLDDVEKLKSLTFIKGVLTDIIVEEATETDRNTVKQLLKRQRGKSGGLKKTITLLFNPILQDHWIYKEYFAPIGWADDQKVYKSDDLVILKTTYKDNRFLEQGDIDDLENETDKYFYEVYTLGNWGVLGNVIFTNWEVKDLSKMRDQFTNIRPGLDFGYADSPVAVGVSHYDKMRKTIYFYDEFYETEISDEQLAKQVLYMIGYSTIICDSAEPKAIAKLRELKVDARGAKKGPGSVNFGIKWLQNQHIIVDTKCINMQNELRQYKWKEGRDGKPILVKGQPVPVDANNHLIDGGLRYAYEDDMIEQTVEVVENPFYN